MIPGSVRTLTVAASRLRVRFLAAECKGIYFRDSSQTWVGNPLLKSYEGRFFHFPLFSIHDARNP